MALMLAVSRLLVLALLALAAPFIRASCGRPGFNARKPEDVSLEFNRIVQEKFVGQELAISRVRSELPVVLVRCRVLAAMSWGQCVLA